MSKERVDPMVRALNLRQTLLNDDKVLLVDFSGTLEGKDTSRVIDLMPNRAGRFVFRAKVNVKPIDPLAAIEYNLPYCNVDTMDPAAILYTVKHAEFDFPLWYANEPDFDVRRVGDYNLPFILQVGGCNFHDGTRTGGCHYCFVDWISNDGLVATGKTYVGIDDVIDSMLAARERIKAQYAAVGKDINIRVLRVSGGEPIIVLDWIGALWRRVVERGLDFVGQVDTNLSLPYLWNTYYYRELAKLPVKFLAAIKGTDDKNLQENVQSTATMADQLQHLKLLLDSGIDFYPQLYNPNPATLRAYLEKMDGIIDNFSLRAHIGPLKVGYGPTRDRLTAEAIERGRSPEEYIAGKEAEYKRNYTEGCGILDDYLQEVHGVHYREVVRSSVTLG